MSDRLSKYAKPRLDDARLARQWAVISRTPRRSGAGVWLAAGAVAAVALAAVGGWRFARRAPAPEVARAGVAEIDANGSQSTYVLADGSKITTGARAHLLLEETSARSTRVALVSGAADFEVKHDPSRTFVVEAHGVTVVDTGTRFHVEYMGPADGVRVVVTEGSVRLERPGSAASSLLAGETWSSGEAAPPPSATAAASAEAAPADAGRAPVFPAPDDAFARFSAMAERDPDEAFDVFGEAGYPRAIDRATPKQLFELGDAARLSGHPQQAEGAFAALVSRHRDDPRAGLAALQLARLRQDALHDNAGAAAALDEAIALAPDPTLREDAEARRVGVLDAMNDPAACARARDAYLAKYPAGLHRASVAKRCER